MTNILKQFAGWAIALWRDGFHRATIKLTLYYIASVFFILLVSSVATVILFVPPEVSDSPTSGLMTTSVANHEFRESIVEILLVVDFVVFLLVSLLAYFFARRTLQPLKENQDKQVRFMGDVAHELRTPLAVMRAGAETILRLERTPKEYQAFVSDTVEETSRLTKLTNQLLELLRQENNTAHATVTDCDLSELLRHEVVRFTPYAAEHNVTLKLEEAEPVSLPVDRAALIQLLQNLLKNAIDYNRSKGSVTVALAVSATQVTLVVSDTGIGLKPADQRKVFERFLTLDDARTHQTNEGVGLGLSIVQAIVKRHGGTVELTSQLGVGTIVTVKLPRQKLSPASQPHRSQPNFTD